MILLQNNYSTEQLSMIAERFQTSVKNLRRWYNEGVDRKPGCGRKKLNQKAEEELASWILQQSIQQQRRVRRSQLKEKAIELFQDPQFKASKAWQDEFIRAHDIKFLVNKELHNRGMLNSLQAQKFEESLKQRASEPKLEGEQLQIPTEIKQEDKLKKITTSPFTYKEKLEENQEEEVYKMIEKQNIHQTIDEMDEWFITPEHINQNQKYEEDGLKIELQDESEVYFPKQKRVLINKQQQFDQS
ncbi:unnamed protein product [Paramecium pentaurelia]|uniref:HTH CENPB-type domain-containing protein n=1 Tax=Paramecium pentaurelia TaxID=43138 RepID=A0A8S1UCZ1_9CILI|nr:unnamed protein product [Paramecium pentaurelia]